MLRSISTVKILLIAITALVFGAGNLLAESPAKPEFFSITPVMGNNSIYLMAGWTESQGDEPEGFKIYFSVGMKKEYDGFLLYKDIDNMQDTLLRKFENNYAYLLNSELKKGTYSFYITAYNKDGESENSEICYMEIKDMEFPDDYITFTSVPVTEAAIGEK